jgi:seryl-tRNA synthetase
MDMKTHTPSFLTRILSAAALTTLLAGSTAFADPASSRAKKTSDSIIDYMMKVYKVIDVDDCSAARDALTKFTTDHATERDAIATELEAARADKAYETALKAEMKKAQGKLKGLKKPTCAANQDVRKVLRTAMPKGL